MNEVARAVSHPHDAGHQRAGGVATVMQFIDHIRDLFDVVTHVLVVLAGSLGAEVTQLVQQVLVGGVDQGGPTLRELDDGVVVISLLSLILVPPLLQFSHDQAGQPAGLNLAGTGGLAFVLLHVNEVLFLALGDEEHVGLQRQRGAPEKLALLVDLVVVVGVLVHVVVALGALGGVLRDVVIEFLGVVAGQRQRLQRQVTLDGVEVLVAVVALLHPLGEVIHHRGLPLEPATRPAVLVVVGLHRQVGGVAVAAQPADVGQLPLEGPLAPLAGAAPVGDGLVAHLAVVAALGDHHVIDAVVTLDLGVDAVVGEVLDLDGALPAQPQGLLAHIPPGSGADRLVGLDQVHPLAGFAVQARRDVEVAQPLNLTHRVVAKLLDRVIVVIDLGLDLDVLAGEAGVMLPWQRSVQVALLEAQVLVIARVGGVPERFRTVALKEFIDVVGTVEELRVVILVIEAFALIGQSLRVICDLIGVGPPVIIAASGLGEQVGVRAGVLPLLARLARQGLGGAGALLLIDLVVGGDGGLVAEQFDGVLGRRVVGEVGGVVLVDVARRLGREHVGADEFAGVLGVVGARTGNVGDGLVPQVVDRPVGEQVAGLFTSHLLHLGFVQPDIEPSARHPILGTATGSARLDDLTPTVGSVNLSHVSRPPTFCGVEAADIQHEKGPTRRWGHLRGSGGYFRTSLGSTLTRLRRPART